MLFKLSRSTGRVAFFCLMDRSEAFNQKQLLALSRYEPLRKKESKGCCVIA